jgi:sortase (surface protein transpeptidase)
VQGFGFFAALLEVGVGDRVTVGDGKHSRTFRVTATTLVRKDILAADTQALGQDGPPRLVLITCSGRWQPELRSYESNLVVLATPIDQG